MLHYRLPFLIFGQSNNATLKSLDSGEQSEEERNMYKEQECNAMSSSSAN